MKWRTVRDIFIRNWREKLLSLLLALLLWFMIKAQFFRPGQHIGGGLREPRLIPPAVAR